MSNVIVTESHNAHVVVIDTEGNTSYYAFVHTVPPTNSAKVTEVARYVAQVEENDTGTTNLYDDILTEYQFYPLFIEPV